MDTIVSFTVGQLIGGFLAVCAGVSCIALAISWTIKGWNKVREPERKQDERLTNIESRLARHDELLDKDNKRLEAIEEGHRVTQRAILALLAHGIDGNDIDALRAAKTELQDYLIKR